MRDELSVGTPRSSSGAATDDGAWAVVGLCTVGWLVWIYLAFQYLTPDEIATINNQLW
jgi:hypothetical protein